VRWKTLAKLPDQVRYPCHPLLTVPPGATIVLLHQGAGSTIDHFLRAPLEAQQAQILELDSARPPNATTQQDLLGAAAVVVVRYLPRPWLACLRQAHRGGIPLVLLMDDDLLDPKVLQDLPRPYRRRLQERITDRRRWVPKLFDRLLVTSAPLARKYAGLGAEQLPLWPHARLLAPQARLQLAYLGTSVHTQEFLWLLPLLESLQQRQPHTHVDLFGDLGINRMFRHLPRVRILHPMAWSNYLAETGPGRIDLLLSPLLESPFNACRAPVKTIDAARSGAVGLYSDRPPYRGFVRDGIDGLLLADDQARWLAAIERLIDAPEERQRLAGAGRARALALSRGEAG